MVLGQPKANSTLVTCPSLLRLSLSSFCLLFISPDFVSRLRCAVRSCSRFSVAALESTSATSSEGDSYAYRTNSIILDLDSSVSCLWYTSNADAKKTRVFHSVLSPLLKELCGLVKIPLPFVSTHKCSR